MKTSNEIMTYFILERVSVVMYAGHLFRSDSQIEIKAKRSSTGVEVEIRCEGNDIELVMNELYEKWVDTIHGGVPEFRGPLLEAAKVDDAIQF